MTEKPDERVKPNGRQHRRDSIGIKVRYAVAIITALIAAFAATEALVRANDAIHRVEMAQRVELALHARSIQLIYQTDYRLCLRGQVTRAALNLHIANDPKPHTRALPLYDCTPDLHGGTAARLTAKQTRAFEHYVLTAKNPP